MAEDEAKPEAADIMNGGRPYTLDGLAERWECSGTHVRRLCAAGKLRHFRIGSLYRIPVDAVLEYEIGAYGDQKSGGGAGGGEPPAPAASVPEPTDPNDPVATYVRSFRERVASQSGTPHLPTTPRQVKES